jgi:hypothetical protein
MIRCLAIVALILTAVLLMGCGGSRTTGKFSNLDKPKSVEPEK